MLPIIALLVSFTLSANLMASKISEKPDDFICNEIQAKSRILKQFADRFSTITPEINNVIENAYNNILSSSENYKMEYNKFKGTKTKFYSMSLVEQLAVACISDYIMNSVYAQLDRMNFKNKALIDGTATDIQRQLLETNDQKKQLNDFVGRENIIRKIHETIHSLTTKIRYFYEEKEEISQGSFSQPVLLPCGHMIDLQHGTYYSNKGKCSTCSQPISMQTLLKQTEVK
jgi:hypothetical protein